MNRSLSLCAGVLACVVFVVSCAGTPSNGNVSSMKYPGGGAMSPYSGSSESGDAGHSPDADKAVAPAAIRKLKSSEAIARAEALEDDMDAAIASGDYTAAFSSYTEASQLLSGVSSSSSRLAGLRKKVSLALDSLVLAPKAAPRYTSAGTAFATPFSFTVSVSTPSGEKPAAGFPCLVSYPSVDGDGSPVTVSETKRADAGGIVSFTAPVPARAGKGSVVVTPDFVAADDFLKKELRERSARGELVASLAHLVHTSAKRVPTTISILDFSKDGKPIVSANVSATALLKPLVQRGFSRIGMADFPNQLASGDEAALLKAARAQFGSGVQRFIFGTTRVESLAPGEDGQWSCSLAVSVSVWDFTRDKKTLTAEFAHVSTGKTEALALDAARKDAAGNRLVEELLYGL